MLSAQYFERNMPDAMVAYASVGFCVAVRHLKGNARSLCLKDGDRYRFLRFFRATTNANERMTAAYYNMCSIEYLFHECNMHKHALGVELYTPIILCGKPTTEIVLLNVNCTEQEAEQLTQNVLNAHNTNSGKYVVTVSDDLGNPFNPQCVVLDLCNVKKVY